MYELYDEKDTFITAHPDQDALIKEAKAWLMDKYRTRGYNVGYYNIKKDGVAILAIYPAINFNVNYY